MSLSVAIIDALLAAGTTREQIAAAMKADIAERETEEADRLARKREAGRIRQQNKRERDNALSRDVTSVTRDSVTNTPPPLPPLKNPPDPLKITPPISPTPPSKMRARRLPDDWLPEPLTGKALAMIDRWQAGELERELAKFRNYWMGKAGKDACKIDWQRTWINWLISADERKPNDRPANNMGRHQSPDGLSSTARAGLAVFGSSDPRH